MATTAKQQQTQTVRGSSASSTSASQKTKSISPSSSFNNTSGGGGILSGKVGGGVNSGGNFIETEEDIATIAKQISDHAEAIYQTWKARGLAPTEILNCHTGTSDAFGKALTPTSRSNLESPVTEFLAQSPDMSNNNLEKLVSSFVSEDKARQQAARKNTSTIGGVTVGGSNNVTANILTSGTIKDALRKFENNTETSGYVKPNFLISRNSSSKPIYQKTQSNNISITSSNTNNSTVSASCTNIKTPTSPTTQLSKNVPDVLMDTINQAKQMPKTNSSGIKSSLNSPSSTTPTTPTTTTTSSSSLSSLSMNAIDSSTKNINNKDSISNSCNSTQSSTSLNVRKPQTPAKPANLINHTPSWPLKNRLNLGNQNVGSNLNTNTIKNGDDNSTTTMITTPQSKLTSKKTKITNNDLLKNSSNDLLDEVSREEERLINALKTGIVLNNNDNKLPEVITSTLTDKTDRQSNWIKPDVSTTSPVLLSTTTSKSSTVAAKNSLLTSSSSSLSSTNSSTTTTTTTSPLSTSTIISPTSSITTGSKIISEQQKQTIGGNKINKIINVSTAWKDDPVKTIMANDQQTQQGISTTLPSALQKSLTTTPDSIMSPVPAPTPKIKFRPKNDAAVPHPEAKEKNIRPFLTRGSVAERVLMFEKCPDVKAPLRNINREPSKMMTKPLSKPTQQTHTTLQRHIRSSSKNVYIPRFHFPHGKPLPTIAIETTLQRLVSAFDSFTNNQCPKDEFHHILKICQLPYYWRMPLMACTQHATSGLVDGYRFIEFWKQMSVYCHDTASRFVYILSRGQRSRPYILHEDLASLVQDVVDTHPGLAFLKEAAEFHSRYVHTVIARIFYSVNRSWSGKISVPELRRSNLLQVIQLLEEEEDINQIMAFFSYEHFYVIYCKFWELDRDHDLFIDQNDLQRHNDHALSTRIIERIFSGCVTRGGKTRVSGPNGPKMSYTDFVWFLLSEEDKTNPTAIEYWFRCMDLDGDGFISMYELEYFYEEQQQRMESIGIETLPFEDCLCQMLDMIKPIQPGCITLGDLKRCRMTPIFFDTFFNLEKYLEHEQRDPFATQRDNDDMTDWDRYAAQEYELLVAEEGGDTQG